MPTYLQSFRGHTICPHLLSPSSVVIDLGANKGEFSRAITERFGCSSLAVEPSPEIFASIPTSNRIRKFNLAVCGSRGPVTLNISSNPEATSIGQLSTADYIGKVTVEGERLQDFVSQNGIGHIDLLKVDVEGAEIDIFASCSDAFLRGIDQITVEFHEWGGLVTTEQVNSLITRLKQLGFIYYTYSTERYSDVLFVNSRCISPAAFSSYVLVSKVSTALRRLRPAPKVAQ